MSVGNAVFFQGTFRGADADHFFQRIVWFTYRRKQFVAGPQIAHQGQRQRMGAAGDLRAHQRILRVEKGCIYLLQGIPAQVIVAVTSSAKETRLADPAFLHGQSHFQLIIFCRLVNLPEALLQGSKNLFSEPDYRFRNTEACVLTGQICNIDGIRIFHEKDCLSLISVDLISFCQVLCSTVLCRYVYIVYIIRLSLSTEMICCRMRVSSYA